MNIRLSLIVFFIIIGSGTLFSQEIRIDIQLSKDHVIEWSISDENYVPVITSEMFGEERDIHFYLPENKHYKLNISLNKTGFRDSIIFNLQLKGNDIISILDTKEGDLSLPFFTGASGNQLKIIGGSDAEIEDFPWQIYLKAGRYLCGGSIISEKWVLTAAHCVFDESGVAIPITSLSVKAGTSYPSGASTGKVYYVENVIVHEDYSTEDYLNDIALLELKDSIDFTIADYIELVSADEIAEGAADPGVLSTVTGWGLTAVNPDEFPDYLQKVQLPIVSNETVRGVWGTVHESVLMAGYINGNKDACSGDSGGPLIVPVRKNFRLAGVVSWGDANCSTYGAYTRVSYFEDWIRNNSGVQRRFIPDEPDGDSIICESVVSTQYTPVPVPAVSEYEWTLSPAEAGSLSILDGNVEILWTENFTGNAELGIRGLYEGSFSEWTYKSIEKIKTTAIVEQSADTSVCSGSSVIFSIEPEGKDFYYTWSKNGEFFASGSVNLISFYSISSSVSGIYSCKVDGLCGSVDSESMSLEVYPSTKILSASQNLDLSNGESSVLELNTEGHELSYLWFKDREQIVGEELSSLGIMDANAQDIGVYNAVVAGTCGVEESDSIYVFVSELKKDNNNSHKAIIWPSIVENELSVAVDSDAVYSITIYDIYGNFIRSISNCRFQTRISAEGLSAGTYILKLDSEVHSETFRFIVL